MRDYDARWQPVAHAFYDGNCRLCGYNVLDHDLVNRDPRIGAFVRRYAGKVGSLDTLPQQRDYPLQSPWHAWLLLRPGDVELCDGIPLP